MTLVETMTFMSDNDNDNRNEQPIRLVANNSTAKLMYYLSCCCTVFELLDGDDESKEEMQKYSNYSNYDQMNVNDKNRIIQLCLKYDPRLLNGKVFYQHEDTGRYDNQYFNNINQIRTTTTSSSGRPMTTSPMPTPTPTSPAPDTILINGVNIKIKKIMLYRQKWLTNNYIRPLGDLVEQLRRHDKQSLLAKNMSKNCIIL